MHTRCHIATAVAVAAAAAVGLVQLSGSAMIRRDLVSTSWLHVPLSRSDATSSSSLTINV